MTRLSAVAFVLVLLAIAAGIVRVFVGVEAGAGLLLAVWALVTAAVAALWVDAFRARR